MTKTQTKKLTNAIREYGDLLMLSGAFDNPGSTVAYVAQHMPQKLVKRYSKNTKLITKRLNKVIATLNKSLGD